MPRIDLDLQEASDSGVSSSDELTNDATPTVDVIVNRPGIISLDFDEAGANGVSQTVNAAGTYSFTAPEFSDGLHTLTATLTPTGTEQQVTQTLNLVIDTAGPRVVSTTPADGQQALPPFSQLSLEFSEPLLVSSFTVADVQLDDGTNNIPIVSVTGGTDQFTVNFTVQSDPADLTFRIGPNLSDLAGNLMDQDQDAVAGEDNDDIAVITVSVPQVADLSVTDVTGPADT